MAQTKDTAIKAKQQVRAKFLKSKDQLVANAPSYVLSYSAANKCVEIAREASLGAYRAGEDDLGTGFINVQQKCSEWASLSWNAGRPCIYGGSKVYH